MNERRATRIAASLFIATLVMSAGSFVLVWLSRSAPVHDVIGFRGFDALVAVVFAGVGAIVVARRPSHPIGWLLFAFGATNAPISLTQQYAFFSLVGRADPLPGGAVAAWAQEWVSVSQGALFVLLLLLFPSGHLPSRRWRPVAVLAIAGSALESVGGAFRSGPIPTFRQLDNPFALAGAPGRLVSIGDTVGNVLFLTTVLAAAVSVVLRFRRAEQIERQQLKWVAAASALVAVGLVGFIVTGQEAGSSAAARPIQIFFILAIIGVPIAAGIAILRYRLYDIDRLISRTATYAIVTALLIGAYIGLVVLLQRAVSPLTGSSDLAVAASTLIVAAAFVPVRRRVQTAIDRRFNRARYDAARTIAAFTARLRDEVDLDALGSELLGVVDSTLHPQHASLWVAKS